MTNENSGLKVFCIVTGKQGYLGSELLKKKLEEFESLEAVAAHYICRDAATLLRKGKSQLDVRVELGISNDEFVPLPKDNIEKALGEKVTKTNSNSRDANGLYWWQTKDFRVNAGDGHAPINVGETTKDTCLRPDIYIDDVCETCLYFSMCQLPIKKINGKVPKV